MTLRPESTETMVDIIEDALTLSQADLESKYDQEIHTDRLHIRLDWLDASTTISITVAEDDDPVFRADVDLYAPITDQHTAIGVVRTAARSFCETIDPEQMEWVEDELHGNVNNDIDELKYEMEYHRKREEFRNVVR